MADYCWSLKRDCLVLNELGRKARKRKFMTCAKMCNFLDDYANAKRASCMSVYSYLC